MKEVWCEQCLTRVNEFEKHSLESWRDQTVDEAKQESDAVPHDSDVTWQA